MKIHLTLTPTLEKRLRECAEFEGLSMNTIIRNAIIKYHAENYVKKRYGYFAGAELKKSGPTKQELINAEIQKVEDMIKSETHDGLVEYLLEKEVLEPVANGYYSYGRWEGMGRDTLNLYYHAGGGATLLYPEEIISQIKKKIKEKPQLFQL